MSDNNGWRHRVIDRKRMRVGDLLPNKYNPVRHGASQAARMQGVLDKFGIVTELIAYYKDDGKLTLFDGHLRQGLDPGQEWDVAITDLSQAECDELALYFDPLAGMSTPDGAVMTALMQDLQDVDGVLGEMLEELANDAGIAFADEPPEDPGAQIDKAAELQEKWQVERGQVWEIGRHRLMCGDSTDAGGVGRLMGGEKAGAVVTDPPYGVGVDYGSFQDTQENVRELVKGIMPIILDNLPAALTPGVPAMWDYPRPAWVGAWIHPAANSSGPWGFVGANPILYYGKDPYLSAGKGRRDSSLVAPAARKDENDHPVSKPLNVWTWLVERMTPERRMTVLDPFLGSGTTIVACEQTGRIGYGMEIEPKYCAVTLDRLQRMGLEPRLVSG